MKRLVPTLRALSCLAVGQISVVALSAQTAGQPADEPVRLSAFTVTEGNDQGYRSTNATSGTRTNEPLKHVPLNVQVVNPAFLKDIAATDLYDAIAYTADVASDFNPLTNNAAVIRGFSSSFQLRNFFRWYGVSDAFTTERVEILRGPAAVLYSQAFPGGAVNIVTKTPTDKNAATVTVAGGSYDYFRSTLDANASAGAVAVRLNAVAQDNHSFNQYETRRIRGLAPSFIWRVSPHTRITAEFETATFGGVFEGLISRWVVASPARGIGVQDLYRGAPLTARFLGTSARNNQLESDARVMIEHEVNDHLSAQVSYNYLYQNRNRFLPFAGAAIAQIRTDAGGDFIQQRWQKQNIANSFWGLQSGLVYTFDLAGSHHKVLIGADFGGDHFNSSQQVDDLAGTATARTFKYYLNAPDLNLSYIPGGQFVPGAGDNSLNNYAGYYTTIQSDYWGGRVHTLLGARYDGYDTIYLPGSPTLTTAGAPAEVRGHKVDPMAGVMYAISPALSLYALYSEAYTPNSNKRDAYNRTLGPTTSQGWEVGSKISGWEGRVSGSVSVYDTTQDGAVELDPFPPADAVNPNAFLPSGCDRARGAEMDLMVSPVQNWDLQLSYSYTDARVIDSANPATIGQRLSNQAYNQAGGFTRYTIAGGVLQGLFFGGGIRYRSQALWRYVGTTALENDDLLVYNGLVGYAIKAGKAALRIQLNVDNIFDRQAVIGGASPTLAEPRMTFATITLGY